MVTNNWTQFSHDAIRALRRRVHVGGHPLLLEYTEWPHFAMEYWLIAFHARQDGIWLAVGHWHIQPAAEEFQSMGLVVSSPKLRNWERKLSQDENVQLGEHMAALRAAYPFAASNGITLDGVPKFLLLQEADGLPVIVHKWNMSSLEPALESLDAWLSILRLRRFARRS